MFSGDKCLRCVSPREMSGEPIVSLIPEELDWCDPNEEDLEGTVYRVSILAQEPRFTLFLGCALFLLVLLICSVIIIIHSHCHAAYYYTHEEDRSDPLDGMLHLWLFFGCFIFQKLSNLVYAFIIIFFECIENWDSCALITTLSVCLHASNQKKSSLKLCNRFGDYLSSG